MKKLLFILVAVFTMGAVAQAQDSKAFVQATVATQSAQFSQGLEIGAIKGKDRVSVVGETYGHGSEDRQYFAGIKYARALQEGKVLTFLVTGQALAHIDSKLGLSVAPGAELNLHLGPNVALVAAISSPLFQDEKPFASPGLNLKGATGLQVRF